MAVFVPVFRLVMLFFNIYDSYKVLKLPSPSSRGGGKPSLRAMSQRKRDMKGCLAVWIVWSCFATYERFAEAVVCLFVPFYDEFKLLAMLFLIMTRARGAEPIYLHIIRPFLKPYTTTIDQLLDFSHVVGDVALGLAALPFIYAFEWWTARFGLEPEDLDTESETSSRPPSVAPTSRIQSRPSLRRTATSQSVKSTSTSRSKSEQSISNRTSAGPAKANGSGQNEISPLPPPTSQDESDNPYPSVLHDSPTTQVHEVPQVDEWRQYPAFPSAYPSTPLVKQTQIVTAAVISTPGTLYPSISEEAPQQDFRQSLLLPHNTPNPSYARGLSDNTYPLGVQPDETERITISVMDVDDLDGSTDRADEYESEDEFNITLRTPDPPLRILTSLELPPAASIDDISPLSVPSRSSALTTADNGSSLRTPSSVHSSPNAPDQPPILAGRKRPLQLNPSSANTRPRISRKNKTGATTTVARSARLPAKRGNATSRRPQSLQASSVNIKRGAAVPVNEVLDLDAAVDDRLAPKRLRVSLKVPKAVQITQRVRRHGARPTSPSKGMSNSRVTVAQRPSHLRSSTRLRENTAKKLVTLPDSREGSIPRPLTGDT